MSAEKIARKAQWLLFFGLLTAGLFYTLNRWPLITGWLFMLFMSVFLFRLVFKSAGEVKRNHLRLLKSNERVNERISRILPDRQIPSSKP